MRMEARRSALVLIDLQERLVPAVEAGEAVTARAAVLLRAARTLAIPVLATRQYPKGLGGLVAPFCEDLAAEECHDKLAFSGFAEEGVRAALRDLGRNQFILAGVEAHVCVLQTALDLRAEGYDVAVVADAVSSRTAESRDLALARLRGHGVEIVSLEMVLFEWLERAGTDAFRELSPLIR